MFDAQFLKLASPPSHVRDLFVMDATPPPSHPRCHVRCSLSNWSDPTLILCNIQFLMPVTLPRLVRPSVIFVGGISNGIHPPARYVVQFRDQQEEESRHPGHHPPHSPPSSNVEPGGGGGSFRYHGNGSSRRLAGVAGTKRVSTPLSGGTTNF